MDYETQEEQEALVAKGASQTMKSKHLEGNAVDLMAYLDGRGTWELNVYDEVAGATNETSRQGTRSNDSLGRSLDSCKSRRLQWDE